MKAFLFILVIVLSFGNLGEAKESRVYGTLKVSEVISVCDGDTFKAHISGLHPLIGENISIRIAGIDTPELKSSSSQEKTIAYQAKALAEKILKEGNKIVLKNVRRDKYFRILADVWVDEVNLAQELIHAGLAKPYDGNKKPSWP